MYPVISLTEKQGYVCDIGYMLYQVQSYRENTHRSGTMMQKLRLSFYPVTDFSFPERVLLLLLLPVRERRKKKCPSLLELPP